MTYEIIALLVGILALFIVSWLALQFMRAAGPLAIALSVMFAGEALALTIDILLDAIRTFTGSAADNTTALVCRLLIYVTTVGTSLFLARAVWKSQH